MPWYLENEALFNDEISKLQSSGLQFDISEKDKREGRLVIFVYFELDGNSFNFRCEYPPHFPYFAFKVSCSEFPPGRHINPVDSTFCLFADEHSSWSPSDSLAETLIERIPQIYTSHTSPEIHNEHDVQEGYQLSGQLQYEENSVLLISEVNFSESDTSGYLSISLSNFQQNNKFFTKGMVNKISLSDTTHEMLTNNNFFCKDKIKGRWIILNEIPRNVDAESWLHACRTISHDAYKPQYQKVGNIEIDVLAIIFPEEKQYRETTYNWIFIIRRRHKHNAIATKYNVHTPQIVRSDYCETNNFNARIPRLAGLNNKSVLLIGTGALGSEVSLQLAKAGIGRLTLIDPDVVQIGNLPRWISAFHYVGSKKVDTLVDVLSNNYFMTFVEGYSIAVGLAGKVRNKNGIIVDTHQLILDLIKSVDIVIDCTAESNVSHYLSHYCHTNSTNYIWSTATTGAWGGIVGLASADSEYNIWLEFSAKYHDGTISAPPAENIENIQPIGCFSPTFTGTSFDLSEVSLMATRMSISQLLQGQDTSYPVFEFNVAVLSLWDEQANKPIPASWKTYDV